MIELKSDGVTSSFAVRQMLVPEHVACVYDTVEWTKRTASITNGEGEVIFEQKDVEVPKTWSQLAVNVVVSKYFYGKMGTPQRETSVKQLIDRVADTITQWADDDGMFFDTDSVVSYRNELKYILLHQMASFNSPVWFNVGLYAKYGHNAPSEGPYRWDPAYEYGDPMVPETCGTGAPVPAEDSYIYPQCSACFIQSVDDTIEDIMRLAVSEATLFKHGSGTGTDLSTLRSTHEYLSGGGRPSGPLSFMKIYDRVAGVIKSGGKTRRAAKMQSLGIWHPDVMDFIEAKWKEEQKAHVLIDAGYDGSIDGEAYETAHFQNANLSVRVTDDYMEAVRHEFDWATRGVRDGQVKWRKGAKEIWDKIAECAWHCGDPGVQYHDTINQWHTCPNSGTINASNPCSEYMFLDDTACNLASINLLKFLIKDTDEFAIKMFTHVVNIMIMAQETLVDHSSYPSSKICERSHVYRTLGLGYANLGALLMAMGIPYDSDKGRAMAGAVTSLMSSTAYRASQHLAAILGPCEGYKDNETPFMEVIERHAEHAKDNLDACDKLEFGQASRIASFASSVWTTTASKMFEGFGMRNCQVTVLAPTGTIGFMMDCDTTGVEPDIALVKYKALSGGGMMKIVNQSVEGALIRLGYGEQVGEILQYIDENDTIEGCPVVEEHSLSVFDCAFKPKNGKRSIHYMAHLRMMGAVQKFLSGAISKTVNMPATATPAEIAEVYYRGWRLGLKAVAVYRENSKRVQPLTTDKAKKEGKTAVAIDPAEPGADKSVVQVFKKDEPIEHQVVSIMAKALEDESLYPLVAQALADYVKSTIQTVQAEQRYKLPDTRSAITHKFEVQGHEGYINIGMYDDGRPGEIFITMNKEGSTVRGLMDGLGVAVSIGWQYGVPLKVLADKFEHTRFEPSGFTKNKDIPIAKSLLDYIFRWLMLNFPDGRYIGYKSPLCIDTETHLEEEVPEPVKVVEPTADTTETFNNQSDAPLCPNCGSITVRSGTCYKCWNCGSSLGCS